jgi:dolichol-phosphate mannosyltransferase
MPSKLGAAAEHAPMASARTSPLELTVVIPTLNEQENILPLLEKLHACLDGVVWEALFVDDDSTDGTADRLRELARVDSRVRCVQRVGRRGLSSACVEGVLCSAAPVVAVIDADMQHDERLLPRMLELIRGGDVDIVVGSRYMLGGGLGDWDRKRILMSRFAMRLSSVVVRAELTDPMSGFFMFRRDAFDRAMRQLSQHGFKILVDFFASSPTPLRHRELPYEFRARQHGESKLDAMVAWEYLMLIMDKLFGRYVPVRFVLFSLIGGLGLVVHMSVLAAAHLGVGLDFGWAQATATVVAMFGNFALNNAITYRDKRLHGWRFLRGLGSFVLVCSVGAVANVGVGNYLFRSHSAWWVAGIAGVAVGAVWNYAVSSVFTWKDKPSHRDGRPLE